MSGMWDFLVLGIFFVIIFLIFHQEIANLFDHKLISTVPDDQLKYQYENIIRFLIKNKNNDNFNTKNVFLPSEDFKFIEKNAQYKRREKRRHCYISKMQYK